MVGRGAIPSFGECHHPVTFGRPVEFAGIRDFRLYGFFEQNFPMEVGTPDIYCLMWSNANPGSRGAKAPT